MNSSMKIVWRYELKASFVWGCFVSRLCVFSLYWVSHLLRPLSPQKKKEVTERMRHNGIAWTLNDGRTGMICLNASKKLSFMGKCHVFQRQYRREEESPLLRCEQAWSYHATTQPWLSSNIHPSGSSQLKQINFSIYKATSQLLFCNKKTFVQSNSLDYILQLHPSSLLLAIS